MEVENAYPALSQGYLLFHISIQSSSADCPLFERDSSIGKSYPFLSKCRL